MTNRERQTLWEIFASIELPTDAVLIVHSAIRGLGQQGYRAEAIIEAMLDYLSRGTLLMPTMTWRTVTPANPVFDEILTPSHTGILTEIFRTRYASARSLHPTHSVAGFGEHAEKLLASHHIGDTPVSASSPYGLMRDYPSYAFLLGVGLENCTAIHHPEEMVAPDIYVKSREEAEFYELKSHDGSTSPYFLRRHRRLQRNFNKFQNDLIRAGMQNGNVGGVPWSLIRVSDIMQVVFQALIKDANATLTL